MKQYEEIYLCEEINQETINPYCEAFSQDIYGYNPQNKEMNDIELSLICTVVMFLHYEKHLDEEPTYSKHFIYQVEDFKRHITVRKLVHESMEQIMDKMNNFIYDLIEKRLKEEDIEI